MKAVQASNAAWLAPGSRLDRYDLLLQVDEGGMAVLWLARQHGKHGFDKIVAIKTIAPKLGADPQFQRMFLDEARVVSRIEHPNVAQVLDLGEERGVLFLVMEWVDGESLINVGRTVERRPHERIPTGILTRVMVDACAGLHAAHELTDDEGLPLGVVHRDVSPHNLIVGFRGTTKVIDFGIAKARNRVSPDTAIGTLKGKIAYMAPEQAMGSEVDRRSDVWSAAASMYRFLAGAVPYSATEPVAVLHRIMEGLPAAPLPKTVPEPIRRVVERALDPDAGKRFETAHDMGAALETAMRAAGISTTREDVGAFMAEHLGEARALRAREIDGAVRESRARMRVQLAHAESASRPALPIAQNDPIVAEGVRPSRHPTVIVAPSEPSIVVGDAPHMPARDASSSARPTARMQGRIAVSPNTFITVPIRAQRGASRALVQWIAAICVLGVLLGVAFEWRARQSSRPIAAPEVRVPQTRVPGTAEILMSPPSGTHAVQPTASAQNPDAPMPPSSRPLNQRPATRPIEPRAPDRGSADDLLERARSARRAGRIGDAAALFAAAVERTPTDSEALTGLAEVDEAQGATAKAIVNYRRAVAVNGKYLPARLGLADSLWTSGQRDEATTTYRRIVDQFPAILCPDRARERAAGTAK